MGKGDAHTGPMILVSLICNGNINTVKHKIPVNIASKNNPSTIVVSLAYKSLPQLTPISCMTYVKFL